MNRHSILAVVALMALLAASCGRLPEAGAPAATDDDNPFAKDGTADSVDIAGVVVSSDDTVVAPAEGDDIAPPSIIETPSDSGPAKAEDGPATTATPVTPPPVEQPDPVVPGDAQPGTSGTHTVQSGETLSTIAEKYGITTDALQNANNLSDADKITIGQVLKVP